MIWRIFIALILMSIGTDAVYGQKQDVDETKFCHQ